MEGSSSQNCFCPKSSKFGIEGFFACVQTEGLNTTRVGDDVYDMGGDGYICTSGISELAFHVHDPIVHATNCRWYQSGSYTIEADEPITVTFSPNDCNPTFSLNYKGRTRTFGNYHDFWN